VDTPPTALRGAGTAAVSQSKTQVTGAWSDQRSEYEAARSTTAELALAARLGEAMW